MEFSQYLRHTFSSIVVCSCLTWLGGELGAAPVNVVILAGQSNASGRASVSELPSSPFDSNIEFFYDTDITGASTRLNSGGEFLPLAPPGSTFGPEFGLGRTLYHKGFENLAIIKVTRGGTNLRTDWEKGNTNGDELYSLLMDTVNDAFGVIHSRGDTVNVLGMAWHQGEGDSGYESTHPGAYQSNLTQFISDVRTDLNLPNLPFLIGEVFPVGREHLITAQQATATAVPGVEVIHSTQMSVFDVTTHFDGKSQLWMGTRFANTLAPSGQHVEFEPSTHDVGPIHGQGEWASNGTSENLIVSTTTSGDYVAGQAAGHVEAGGNEQFGHLGLVPVYGRSMTADFFAGDATDHDMNGTSDYDNEGDPDSTVRLYGWTNDSNSDSLFSESSDGRSVGFGLDNDGVFKLRVASGDEISTGVNYDVDKWYRLSLTWTNPDEFGDRQVALFARDLTSQIDLNGGDAVFATELSEAEFGSDPSTWIGTGVRATRGLIDNIHFATDASTADFNLDGEVDGSDLLRWQSGYGSNGYADADGDGDSDGADFLRWQRDYNWAPPLALTYQVPEPTTATLFVVIFSGYLYTMIRFRNRFSLEKAFRSNLITTCTAMLLMQVPNVIAGTIYDFELLNNGAVIASDGNNTAYPSVIRVPSWIAPEDRADFNANYYMYYGNHTGKHIRLKWAQTLDGPWTEFDLGGTYNGQSRRGVFDTDADATRETYDHAAAPDVHIDDVNQQIVMYFHGQNQPSVTTSGGTRATRRHESFVTTSATGLNFNDPLHAGGESGHGPKTVTVDNVTRDIWIGEDYQRAFQKDGNWYSIGKRAIINASPNPLDPWAPKTGDPFGEAWTRESTPSALWTNDANPGGQTDYYSPAATFLASSEFANHPRNPIPGARVLSNGNDERLNHVSVNLVSPDALEVFFYVREANSSEPDRYDDIYRVVLDISDPNFENWDIARDSNGQAFFDVVITAEEMYSAVEAANGIGFDTDDFADPVSLGDTHIFVDDDDSKYLFFSYVSSENGGAIGEGQITAVKLNVHPDFDYDNDVDGRDFLKWQRGDSFTSLSATELAAWKSNYGTSYSSLMASTSVPEPNSSLLLLIALVFRSRRLT